jgi:hypothetical protein
MPRKAARSPETVEKLRHLVFCKEIGELQPGAERQIPLSKPLCQQVPVCLTDVWILGDDHL